eukprot:c19947_g1_i1 orf=514-2145(-)
MESRDGEASRRHDPSSEATLASPSETLTPHSADSPLLTPEDLPASEAPGNPPWRDLSSLAQLDAPADRQCQDPSSARRLDSLEFPLRDLSCSQAEHSSEQQQPDDYFTPQAKSSAEGLWLHSSSAQSEPIELSLRGAFSSDQLLNDASGEDFTVEKAHDASPLHPPNELLASEVPAERVWQEPRMQIGSHESSSSDEDSRAEELLPSTSADHFSHANPLEQRPATMSTYHVPHKASVEEEFHHTSQEQELSDDVKREKLVELCKGVCILSCKSEAPDGSCYVYLIGTAHVSEESRKEVKAAISLMKPQVVFLELCEKRTYVLRRTHFPVPTVSDMIAMWKEQKVNALGILYSWFVAKVAAKLDIFPGSEFRAAYEEALACGAKVVLGDRDIEVTLRRTWGRMSTWHKTKLLSSMVFQALFLPKADQLNELIEKFKDADILTIAFEELSKSFPTVMETLIAERDMFMTAVLQKMAEHHSSIIAVVGRGHLAGITKFWGQEIPIQTLLEIPQKKSIWNATTKLYVLAALGSLISVLVFIYHGSSH